MSRDAKWGNASSNFGFTFGPGFDTLACMKLAAHVLVLVGLIATMDTTVFGEEAWAYFGTYSRGKSKGIYVSHFDLKTGALSAPELAAEAENPSFLVIHPNGRFLYAANEISEFKGEKAGSVSAFAIDTATHKLTLLGLQSSRGQGPCHLVVDRAARHVLLANYGGGSIASLPLRDDGSLGAATSFIQHSGSSVNAKRQSEAHAHSINLDAAGRFAYVPDLGMDKVMIYRFDSKTGALTANDPAYAAVAPGSGPRHFAFSPDGRHAYVINEMLSTITTFTYDDRQGVLTPGQTLSTLPEGFAGSSTTAHVEVHPSGRFVYGSNRGHDSVTLFARNSATGRLTLVEHVSTQGHTPRNFGIDPTGKYLIAANQGSENVTVFRIDPQTGKLHPTGPPVEVGTPVCVKFLVAK